MKKFLKNLLLFTPLILFLLPVIIYISIMLINNGIAYNTLKELKSIELPPNTKIEWSESKAGKLIGSGNGMQYFGSILVDSDLSENELKEYYKKHNKNIEVVPLQENNSFRITMQGNRNIDSEFILFLLDLDLRVQLTMWKIYIKRFFAILSFIATLLALSGIIVMGIDAVKEINRIKLDSSASGIDYLGFEFYPMFIALFSVIGLILSTISLKLFTLKTMKIINIALIGLLALILLVSFPMWFMR